MKKQSGFTIIELLIATAVFSLVLMAVMAGILQLTKMYYQGINQNRTQETARRVIEELADSIRYTNGDIFVSTMDANELEYTDGNIPPSSPQRTYADYTGYFCLGSKRYTYAIDRQLKANAPVNEIEDKLIKHVLWVDENPSAGSCTFSGDKFLENDIVGGTELLSENMRLTKLRISPVTLSSSDAELYKIDVTVHYGNDDLIEYDTANDRVTCKRGITGTEYCAFSEISLTVQKRIE